MNLRGTLLAFFVASLVVPAALADTITPNTTTPVGPGFALGTIATSGTPGLVLPSIYVGLVQQPSNGIVNQTLDLTAASSPLLVEPPDPGGGANFSISWGMQNSADPSDHFVYSLPQIMPDAQGNYYWSATLMDATGGTVATFFGTFQLDTDGQAINTWFISTPPDPDHPGVQTFQIDFMLGTVSDPALTFSLNETVNGNTTPLDFTPVPEPGTMGLLMAGLTMLASLRRKR